MDASLYKRPNKPCMMMVTRRRGAPAVTLPKVPDVVVVDKCTECHVTPPEVARRMAGYLEPRGRLILEPQAGTGNLVQALCDAGHPLGQIVAVERHAGLSGEIRKRFTGEQCVNVVNECFLEHAQRLQGTTTYPRVVMNPPFKQVKKHVNAALGLLAADGGDRALLVALVPITFEHDEAQTLEVLPPDTFSTVRVSTKIIQIERFR